MGALVSICIPTYNGSATLGQTLNSIADQEFDGLEVVICDDQSDDNTVALAEGFARQHPYVRIFRNAQNLGMDRNFARSAQHATGTYVWFCGQDDVFKGGAFKKFREICTCHPEVDIVYFNYQMLSGDLSREVASPPISLEEDAYFASSEDYFRAIDHAPTFLAATVMRRSFWDKTPYEGFVDTHYVQMGVVLHNLRRSHVYVVADPRYVACRVPEESWKSRGGQMLFEIFSGSLEVYHRVFHSDHNPVPEDLYRKKMGDFLRNLPINVVSFSERGFRLSPSIDARMKRLFGDRPLLYRLYVWPLVHLPPSLCALMLRIHRSTFTRWMTRGAGRLLSWLGSRGAA